MVPGAILAKARPNATGREHGDVGLDPCAGRELTEFLAQDPFNLGFWLAAFPSEGPDQRRIHLSRGLPERFHCIHTSGLLSAGTTW
jgi:hypothetical protein